MNKCPFCKKAMNRALFAIIFGVFLTSCGGQATLDPNAIQTAIVQTQQAEPQPTETALPAATNTLSPTNTPRPTNTPAPTATVTDTPAPDTSQEIAKNYVASQDSGGVILEVARVVIANKDAIEQDFSPIPEFDDKPVVVELIFRIVNNTDKTVSLYADQGTVAVNGEQVDLWEYAVSGAGIGDSVGGEFLPGVTSIGGLWFGLKRTALEDVNKITIKISAPVNTNYDSLGKEYLFEIPVEDWGFEPIPDELK